MDCKPPGSSVHAILQARILEWVAIPFSRDLPDPGIKLWSPALQEVSLPYEPPYHYLFQSFSSWQKEALQIMPLISPAPGEKSYF